MLREEAIKYLKEMKDECNDTIHKVRYVTQEEALDMAIKALEQEPKIDVLDKIRERISLEKLGYPPSAGYYKAIVKVLQIIDKYRKEQE